MTSCSFKYNPRLESVWASEPNPVIETMQWGRGREGEGVEWTFLDIFNIAQPVKDMKCWMLHRSVINHSYYCLIMTIKICMWSSDLFHEPQKNEKNFCDITSRFSSFNWTVTENLTDNLEQQLSKLNIDS